MSEIVLGRSNFKKKSWVFRELNAMITIAARDITLTIKSPLTLILSIAMPLIMMGMLGGSLSQNMAGSLGFNYGRYMLIGMLVNMLFMMTDMGISSLIEDHKTDFTQEMMISPITRYSIILGKIIGSMLGAIFSMIGTFVVGAFMGITLTMGQFLAILALAPLMCLSSGALTVMIIGAIKSTKTANMVVSMMVFPQMFLSGAIIPINNSSGILRVLSRLMPMTYCLDLVRAVIYVGTPDYSVVQFNPAINLIAIAVLTVVCLMLGTYLFAQSEKNR